MAPSAMLYMAGALLLSPSGAVLLAGTAMLVCELWARKPWFKVVFNSSQVTISIAAASTLWSWGTDGGPARPFGDSWPFAVAAAGVYFLLNTGLTSFGLALHQRLAFRDVWWRNHRDVFLPQAGMYVMGMLVAEIWRLEPRAVAALAVPAGLTWISFPRIRALEAKNETERQLRAESQRYATQWAALARVSDRLGERVDPEAVLRASAALVAELCADAARVVLSDGREATARRDPDRPELAALLTPDAPPASDRRVLPLRAGGETVGTLHVAWAEGPPDAERAALLEPIADRIALAVYNAVLVEQEAEVETMREIARLKGEFLSKVGHELRSPLSLVVGYGELLRECPQSADEVRWMGDRIQHAGLHLARLVDDLLEAGRLESGRFQLDVRPIDVRAVTDAAVEIVRSSHPSHLFTTDLPDNLPPATADAARVQQVLTNLLSNAARYSPSGGRIHVAAAARDEEIVLSVDDQGPGVPPAERGRVFEKFYRTPDAVQRNKTGLGLGLTICQDIVAAHGGRIWVDEAPGGGARFAFTLQAVRGS